MYESIIGLYIEDEALYQRYRHYSAPIMQEYGGSFGFDFAVSNVLYSQFSEPVNRVFTVKFADQKSAEQFFHHGRYQQIREQYFVPAVRVVQRLAHYQPLDLN